jgi:ACS family glucarate transporter-like MFS transporter
VKPAEGTVQEASQPTLRESPQRWWLMVLLASAMIFCYAQRGALGIAAPAMMKELGLSAAVMGVLLSAFSWSYSFMQVPAGWLVDRFGVKRSYALGFAFWSLVSAVTGFARGLWALIAIRVFMGVGQAVAFPASARAVANWFQQRERGVVTATYLTGVRLGQALINAVGAIMLVVWGWKVFFVVIGLVPLIWLLPWYLFLGKWEPTARSVSRSGAASSQSGFLSSLGLLKNRSVFGIFLGFFAFDYVWFLYVNWLPGYLRIERKFSNVEMGIYSSVPFLAMSVVIVLSGMLSDWLVRRGYREVMVRKVLIMTGLAISCLIVPAGLVEDRMTAVWLLTISLCGLGVTSPNTWTLTQAVCSKNIVGTVSGIQNFGGNVGGIIAPALTGYIAYATHSFALALGIGGVIAVIGILAYWFLIARRVEL